ncbi:uncharacterized protein LY89DRAFT_643530 [Mollisia scopiformis]|uniref:Knr4/Smi1-like domain-containing protein n=1 Tax=Mollisia scopiformis TaxID=149040 RepID=A0A194XFQ8_MOLSC|nr:uncharacterized protein LY89DRAFT_643530 [Mollisia scopiformis]KUJ18964.1 hypothetical protein LY89DRAFT_643530 [Mollisia scopiformis]
MDIYWKDEDLNTSFAKHSLSKLISSYLEPVNPHDAITKTIRLVHLLLLSNHIPQAHELLTAVYKHAPAIVPPTPHQDPPLKYTPLTLEYLWQTHQETCPRPENLPPFRRSCSHKCASDEAHIAHGQWGKYRECTRTGWMLEHCHLPEPEDPHLWKESDDPRMLAMCARLLAKDKTQGEYPPEERLREALEAAKKLYAQPQVCVSEWDYKEARAEGKYRHSALLYRRLVVEVAIRVGELETAAEMMGLGLRIDGFATGSELDVYLMMPGIYDVLPLLAERGKEGNPFLIGEEVADEMVREIVATLELRATKGRQWSQAKVGWEELLNRLAQGAWKVNRKEYKQMEVKSAEGILYEPASEEEIQRAEKKCGELPEDFKDMIRVANGFKGGYHLFGGGLLGLDGMHVAHGDDITDCRLRDQYPAGSMLQLESGNEDCDGFTHYIITPAAYKARAIEQGQEIEEGEYMYWHWAYWQGGGANCWKSVRDFVASCVEEVEGMVERGERANDEDDEDDEDQDSDSDEEDEEDEDEESDEDSGWTARRRVISDLT